MRIRWEKLGGQLAIAYCLAGLFLVFLGWNGAASYDRVSAQIPYVVSGGLGGLALVVIGVGLMIVQSNRADRAALQATVVELRDALDRPGGAETAAEAAPATARPATTSGTDTVLAGSSSYHRPGCRLIEGQSPLTEMTRDGAATRGLAACRVCAPG